MRRDALQEVLGYLLSRAFQGLDEDDARVRLRFLGVEPLDPNRHRGRSLVAISLQADRGGIYSGSDLVDLRRSIV